MRPLFFLPLSLLWLLPSCGKKAAGAPPDMPPAAVTFVPATAETVRITRELPGRIGPVRIAEVRARISGILLQRTFEEGADVIAGQVLFRIDAARLEAARDSAAADLSRADAILKKAASESKRYGELIQSKAVSQQETEAAESTLQVASANVMAAAAALKTAEINLGYATVTAPISGRIGKAQVTEGALVGQDDATRLAVIQQLDSVYFDFYQSSNDLAAFKKAVAMAADNPDQNKATLLLDDGSDYEFQGKILFSEASVDETTGMVSLRAAFPNPKHELLPGMFVRARVIQAVRENAITIPLQAVARGVAGKGSVVVIDDHNQAHSRAIETGELVGDKWVVKSGLMAGERVIMEGHLKVKPGASVVPSPFVPAAETRSSNPNKK